MEWVMRGPRFSRQHHSIAAVLSSSIRASTEGSSGIVEKTNRIKLVRGKHLRLFVYLKASMDIRGLLPEAL